MLPVWLTVSGNFTEARKPVRQCRLPRPRHELLIEAFGVVDGVTALTAARCIEAGGNCASGTMGLTSSRTSQASCCSTMVVAPVCVGVPGS